MAQTVKSPWQSAPAVTPLVSGILDHATIVEGVAWQRPVGLGVSYNCLDTAVPTELCPQPTTPKEFSSPASIDGFEFAVYGGISCKPFGFDTDTGLREVERVFGLKESRGVERALMETGFVAGPPFDTGNLWEPAVDLTPVGGAVSPRVALAVLEGYAASIYSGQPTIHAPYTIGALLAGRKAVVSEAGKFYSRVGSKVAIGAGYEFPNSGPTGAEAAIGERWMYVTGEVLVARSETLSRVVHDTTTNDIVALAERRYITAFDCFAAGIRVRIEG